MLTCIQTTTVEPGTVEAALSLAVRAPSVHNTQPWHWRVGARTVQLDLARERRLPETDPDDRERVVSCGIALQHFAVAARALAMTPDVHLLPNPAVPEHLAAVELTAADEPIGVDLASAIARRRTDRRRPSTRAVSADRIGALLRAAGAPGVQPVWLRGRPVDAFVALADEAVRDQLADAAWATEVAAWSGRHPGSCDGVPASATPPAAVGLDGARPFAHPELGDVGTSRTASAELIAIATRADDRRSHLLAGEATGALLLEAERAGLAVMPTCHPLERPDLRARVREEVLGGTAYPQMVLRVAWPSARVPLPPPTPRLPLAAVVSALDDVASA